MDDFWDRDSSASPLPRYDDPRNNYVADDEPDGLPRFPSTMPPPRIEKSPLADRRIARPASEPEEPYAHLEQAQRKKKKKKKKRSSALAEETAEQLASEDAPIEPAPTQPGIEQLDTTETKRKKKKKKGRLSEPSQQLIEEQEATASGGLGSPVAFFGASSSLNPQPPLKKHKKRRKSQEGEEKIAALPRASTPEIVIPSSLRTSGSKKERRRTGSNGSTSRPRLGSPFESVIGSSYAVEQTQVDYEQEVAEDEVEDDEGLETGRAKSSGSRSPVYANGGQLSANGVPQPLEDDIESVGSDVEGRRFARREPSIDVDEEDAEAPISARAVEEEDGEPNEPQDGLRYDNTFPINGARQAGELEDPFVDGNVEENTSRNVEMRHPEFDESQQQPSMHRDFVEDEQLDESVVDAPNATPTKARKKSKGGKTPGSQNGSVQRKPKTSYFDRPSQEAGEGETVSDEEPKTAKASSSKKPREKKPREKSQTKKPRKSSSQAKPDDEGGAPATDDKGYRVGALTAAEERAVRGAVEAYRDFHDLTDKQIAQLVQTRGVKKSDEALNELWTSVSERCPTRPRTKLIKWCRHQFHDFVSRGTWTEEQDDELDEMIKAHGKKWTLIGGLINRHPDDIRDRYRNYLICRNTASFDYWSKEEEERLYDAVQEATNKLRNAQGQSQKTGEELEGLINWQLISDAMGRTRTRLQCMSKWKQLGENNIIPNKVSAVLPSSSSTRLRDTRKDLRKISVEDKYTLVLTIKDSSVTADSEIPWRAIVKDTFNNQYQRKALMVTWARLRDAVPNEDGRSTADIATSLCEMYENEGGFDEAAETDHASTAAPSQRSSPVKSIPSTSVLSFPGSQAPKRASNHTYRTPRPSSVFRKGLGQSSSRLSLPALERVDRVFAAAKKRRSMPLSASRINSEDEEEAEEVEDSAPEEVDVNAPPREPTASPEPRAEEDRMALDEQQEREPSVELGADQDDAETSFATPAFPASSHSKSSKKTYSSRNKRSAKGKKKVAVETEGADEEPAEDNAGGDQEDAVMEDAPETPSRKKGKMQAQDTNLDGSSPPKKRKTKPAEESASQEQATDEQDVQTPRRRKHRPVEASPAVNGTNSASPKKRKSAAVEEPEPEVEQTPRRKHKKRDGDVYSVQATPLANGAGASPTKKRRLAPVEEETRAAIGWKAINKGDDAGEVVASQPLDARSVLSSNMDDDMEDIPRSGQLQARVGRGLRGRSPQA
ncbi:hypothetical protein OQA88_9890 [Cercophora sp. LCS_1]